MPRRAAGASRRAAGLRRWAVGLPRRAARLALTLLWTGAVRMRARLRPQPTESQIRRHEYSDQATRIGLRLTEAARDRLRPRWLRLRR